MIKVVMKDGKAKWIAAGHVVNLGEGADGLTTILFDSGAICVVQDRAEDVARKIHEIIIVS
jgi:uncharacterized protein YlzI (FlbEa/FlbD family)